MTEYGLPGWLWFLIGVGGMIAFTGATWAWAAGLLDQPACGRPRAAAPRPSFRPRHPTRPVAAAGQHAATASYHKQTRTRALASDRERDTTISQLADAYAQGRLTRPEHDHRAHTALTARTRHQLAALTTDLPPTAEQP